MLNTSTISGYENLANAIIIQAADDYRKALNDSGQGEQRTIFHSEWFGVLTGLDPETLIRKLKQEAKNI